MKVSWLNTIRDRISLWLGLIFLILPIAIYCLVTVTIVHNQKRETIADITSETLTEFEIILDHLNGALINLQIQFEHCDISTLNYMHKLSFELPGIEAFLVLGENNAILCSNWLHDLGQFPVALSHRHNRLQLTGEVYIPQIGKRGVAVYRTSSKGLVVSIMASAYLKQLMTAQIQANESLVLYNGNAEQLVASKGLTAPSFLELIQQEFSRTLDLPPIQRDNLFVQRSEHYPEIAVAYFFKLASFIEILKDQILELALISSLSLGGSLSWLAYRHQKVHSMPYQIHLGLKHHEFEPYLQPVVDMRSNQWVGAECLTRWHRHGHTVAFPDEFIVAAEDTGLIKELTAQVAEKLGNYIDQQADKFSSFYFSVNLSPNFIDQATVEAVEQMVAKSPRISPENLRFEITERGLNATNKNVFQDAIDKLRKQGYLFGLDDFGTGQSGLEYFSNIEPDFLKLDRRFVTAIDTPESVDFLLLKTIVQLAKSLKLFVIAEGVETETQQNWLLENSIFYGQGWLFQSATSTKDFSKAYSAQKNQII